MRSKNGFAKTCVSWVHTCSVITAQLRRQVSAIACSSLLLFRPHRAYLTPVFCAKYFNINEPVKPVAPKRITSNCAMAMQEIHTESEQTQVAKTCFNCRLFLKAKTNHANDCFDCSDISVASINASTIQIIFAKKCISKHLKILQSCTYTANPLSATRQHHVSTRIFKKKKTVHGKDMGCKLPQKKLMTNHESRGEPGRVRHESLDKPNP